MNDLETSELADAVKNFSRDSISRHARSVIARLQKISDGGAHPLGWDMRSLWSLYSWEVQNGPSYNYELVHDMVTDIVNDIAQKIPPLEARIINIHLGPENYEHGGAIHAALMDEVSERASSRNLDRYDPDYRWYDNI